MDVMQTTNFIKRLSQKTVNRIAAGEVILSPINVVKELIENSIDASSTKIDVTIERGGRNFIGVVDNGIGISKHDLPLVIERYATSKLEEESIFDIKYMGFRGEAMHSIDTVSHLSITSRHVSSDNAWKLCKGKDDKPVIIPAQLLCGTFIEVRDLFFSTPTRIKFLRNEKAELNYIIELINKFALMYPNINFKLISDGKNVLYYKSSSDFSNRILEIKDLGENFLSNICHENFQRDDYDLTLFASKPTFNSAKSNYFIFVNKRPIKDVTINSAIKIAYYDYIPKDRFPTVIIFLSLPTSEIDVNVHPTKNEIRFLNPEKVKKFIIAGITRAISKSIIFSPIDDIDHNMITKHFSESYQTKASELNETKVIKDVQKPIHHLSEGNNLTTQGKFSSDVVKDNFTNHTSNVPTSKLKKETFIDPTIQQELIKKREYCIKCQIYETYIIAEKSEEIIIIDQHAAHERLLYEEFKKNLNKESQMLLISEVIELPSRDIETLEEKRELLDNIGLKIEKFGTNLIMIHKIPVVLMQFNIKSLIIDLINDDLSTSESLEQKIERVYANIACKNAIKANTILCEKEMYDIVDKVGFTDFSAQCNHGRPTYIKISKKHIEKMFCRK